MQRQRASLRQKLCSMEFYERRKGLLISARDEALKSSLSVPNSRRDEPTCTARVTCLYLRRWQKLEYTHTHYTGMYLVARLLCFCLCTQT